GAGPGGGSRARMAGTGCPSFHGMVGQSAAMRALFERIERVAPLDVPVLILGETGTGKELVARAIQRLSRRAGRPFETINCGALTRELLPSELFGHERGAFTGAVQWKTGLLAAADGGTVFLDEIGELPADAQAMLLRFLQDGEIRPVGSTRTTRVDVRLIAATHRDLEAEIERGAFRDDLYYRLRRVVLEVPPLRLRR
ncbi:sigma-54 factor interaction domain-containing protein, partial [Candidatus Binatia bacterium]|nr:sigma-54 factor interaction domain-containing protein [Candidatus Binatia bacterium]